jgi:hypothetical protein
VAVEVERVTTVIAKGDGVVARREVRMWVPIVPEAFGWEGFVSRGD